MRGRHERGDALGRLARGIVQCRRCPLHEQRRHAVPGAGPEGARIMFIGEAPGAREDATGEPFVGRAGGYLDILLARIGLTRSEIFITGSVKCRPPGNRTPRTAELRTCRELWLAPQIAAIDPAVLVLLGGVAARQVLGERRPLAELRGPMRRWHDRHVLVTAHPAAAMRFPRPRRWLDEDFVRLQAFLQALGQDREQT
jgi:uracil-DNA glycosylase